MILRKLSILAAVICLIISVASAEPTTATRLTFEVASIKLSPSGPGAVYGIKPLPGGSGYTAEKRSIQADDEPDVQGAHAPDPRRPGLDQ